MNDCPQLFSRLLQYPQEFGVLQRASTVETLEEGSGENGSKPSLPVCIVVLCSGAFQKTWFRCMDRAVIFEGH